MKKSTKRNIIRGAMGVGVCGAIALLLLVDVKMDIRKENLLTETKETDTFLFSHESGFYEKEIKLDVRMLKKGIIYYTADGSEPNPATNSETMVYEKDIPLTAMGMDEYVWNLRFRANYTDGTWSKTDTKTFVIGDQINSRYDTLVMNVVTSPDNLYGYENGIFTEGKLRDEYLAAHPDEEENGEMPANYNVRGRESERPVHIDIFDEKGNNVVSQDAGIRVSGGLQGKPSKNPLRYMPEMNIV